MLLEARTRDMGDRITASERDAAKMMPYLMKRVRAEAAASKLDLEVQLVSKPSGPEKKKIEKEKLDKTKTKTGG